MKRVALIVSIILVFLASPHYAGAEDLIEYLKQTGTELEKKQLALEQKEDFLKKTEEVIDKKIKKLNALLEEIRQYLRDLEKMRSERIKHVVATYEKMSPEDAALRLEGLAETKATEILLQMNPRKAAKVLSNMDPQKATALTERLTELGGFERIKRHLR